MKRSVRSLWLAGGGLAALAVALWLILHHAPPAASPPAQPQVPLATVHDGTVEETLDLAGRVGAAAGTQVKLAFAVPGTVRAIDVRLGQSVQPGEALAQLDGTSYALGAQQAAADAQAASAAAALARIDRVSVKLRVDRAELRRQQLLYHAGVVALRDVQATQATLAADRADELTAHDQLAQARAQARAAGARAAAAEYDASRTTLRAPNAGIVVGIFAQPGDSVDTTVPVVSLAAAQQRTATLDVPVDDVARLAQGQLAHVRAGGLRWDGRVEGVARAVDPATGLAVVSVSGVPDGVPAGTPVDAKVVVGQARGLVIPASAVVEDPQSGQTLAFVETHDGNGATTFAARKVTISARNDRFVRVASGLRAGQRVASQGAVDLLAPSSGG
jgi:RND family efflux transporter MFP subunit